MEIISIIDADEEIQMLRKRYMEQFGKRYPLFNFDEFKGIDDYREKLREMVETNQEWLDSIPN